jgi:TonB family protein
MRRTLAAMCGAMAAWLLAAAALAAEPTRGVPFGRSDAPGAFRWAFEIPPAVDREYGYTPAKPIRLGPGSPLERARVMRLFLASLGGPQGQPVEFERLGSCCRFERPGAMPPVGLLDQVRVQPDGGGPALLLYFDLYTDDIFMLPTGLTQLGLPVERGRSARLVNAAECLPAASDYPPVSIANNETGTTRLRVTVGADGRVKAFGIVKSSGHVRLDVATVQKLAECRFIAGTNAEGRPADGTLDFEYEWRLQ